MTNTMQFIDIDFDSDLGVLYIEVECCFEEGEVYIERVNMHGVDVTDSLLCPKLHDMVHEALIDCGEAY